MLPVEFSNRMKDLLGNEYEPFIASYDKPPYQALRLSSRYWNCRNDEIPNSRCAISSNESNDSEQGNTSSNNKESNDKSEITSAQKIASALSARYGWTLSPVPWAANGFYYAPADRPGRHVLHEAGAYYIQEPSAMTPVSYLDARPGMNVLDLCAAPGGKSTQIADAMEGKGILISNEIVPNRAKILSENIERMGISNAMVTNESPDSLAEHFPAYFDRILVDAPCSGEGMFRKNTDAETEWSPENVQMCADRDDAILDAADRMLVPGGRLVFSTCTFEPAENEGSIYRFLVRHPDYSILPVEKYPGMEAGRADWIPQDQNTEMSSDIFPSDEEDNVAQKSRMTDILSQIPNTIRLWPHKLQGEGHFLAVLQKDGTSVEPSKRMPRYGFEKGLKEKVLKEWQGFSKTSLDQEAVERLTENHPLTLFGDNLYVLPEHAPSTAHLKVLRPGLHLGTIKKGRFEPAFALSHVLAPSESPHAVALPVVAAGIPSDFTAERWIAGETFRMDGENGWYLVCADGYPLSWGKLAGGTMKNHYPRGLRKNL